MHEANWVVGRTLARCPSIGDGRPALLCIRACVHALVCVSLCWCVCVCVSYIACVCRCDEMSAALAVDLINASPEKRTTMLEIAVESLVLMWTSTKSDDDGSGGPTTETRRLELRYQGGMA